MMWSEQKRLGGGGRSRRDLWAMGTTLFFPRSDVEPHKGSEQGRDVA